MVGTKERYLASRNSVNNNLVKQGEAEFEDQNIFGLAIVAKYLIL